MKKTITATLIAGAATAALMGAGTAQADYYAEDDRLYLSVLSNRFNITEQSAPSAIRWGQAACKILDKGQYSAATVAVAMGNLPEFAGPAGDQTGYIVGAAIGAYCPWNKSFLNV